MKLCLISPVPPPYGGVANWEKIVAEEIDRNPYIKLSIIDISPNKREMDGRTIFDRVFYSGKVMLRAFFQLRKMVSRNTPDVVHMNTSGGLGFYRDLLFLHFLKRKHIPSVYHVHFGRTVLYKEQDGRCWKQIKKAVALANATIVLDDKTLNALTPYAKQLYQINNPINVSSLKGHLNDSEVPGKFVYIGWIIKNKGIEELLEAFSDLKGRAKDLTLELVGPAREDYLEYLKQTYKMEGVTFHGEIDHDDAMNIMASASAVVLPSYTEGFPNVILEAMALKKCIIATNVGAIPDMLAHDSGIIIEPKDVNGLVKAMEIPITNSEVKKQMSKNAYERVVAEYDVSPTQRKYEDVWNSVIVK